MSNMRTANLHLRYGFRSDEFYTAVARIVRKRNVFWHQLANEIGTYSSTFTRWARGRSLDARILAALSAWAGLNPADFVGVQEHNPQESLARILAIARDDANLSAEASDSLQALIRTAYEQLSNGAKLPAAHPDKRYSTSSATVSAIAFPPVAL